MFLFFSEQLSFWATRVFLQNSLGLNVLVAFFFVRFLIFRKLMKYFISFYGITKQTSEKIQKKIKQKIGS